MTADFGFDAASSDPHDGEDSAPDSERDLLVVLRLSNRQMGTNEERADLALLADGLERAVLDAGVGEYDGDEYGGGECTLFFCGQDEDALLGVLRPHLLRSGYGRGAVFVRLVEGADGEMQRETIPV